MEADIFARDIKADEKEQGLKTEPSKSFYCADLSGALHWGETADEARKKATEANREMLRL